MSVPCVFVRMNFTAVDDRDATKTALDSALTGITPIFKNDTEGVAESGREQFHSEMVFLLQLEADSVYTTMAAEIVPPDATGLVSKHVCPHFQGEAESEWYDCKTATQAQYQETVG